uniref:LTD domain-containing protein n=1 Tax=Pseudictyota dubia TaxID=2749911 RepID=A0A7R9Z617_9STRA|mmetsp:Transcript_24450/g.45198  ORF Transcript_24450/g.45198 Transcript_24450/m.45198 type:complete len:763 (+) Transcript_24450:101-2389(+)
MPRFFAQRNKVVLCVLGGGILPFALPPGVHADAIITNDSVRINEVSDKGTSAACNGNDWIELHLPPSAPNPADLGGYILHDNDGPRDADAFSFSSSMSSSLDPGGYLLLCEGEDFQFGIGGTDAITLLDSSGTAVSSTGSLTDRGALGVSFAYDDETGDYAYTSTPTPGGPNVITRLPQLETIEEMRKRLKAQNDEGAAFFNMADDGRPVEGGFGEVVDLRMEADAAEWEKLAGEDRSHEMYSPFLSASLTAAAADGSDGPAKVLANLTSPGRIRPKGQSTLFLGICMDKSVPYSIDWDYYDPNQTLFGVRKAYLRTPMGDFSFVREWTSHRMLARFGLPHLRARTVRFFVNGDYVGLYELLEAPDQDYVFHRSFPDFDPKTYALFKVKTLSLGCGLYDENALARAQERVNEEDTPPYSFERGEHRDKISVLGPDKVWECLSEFNLAMSGQFEDVTLAYVRSSGECGEMLVKEGLVDRDLGSNAQDEAMEAFIDRHLAGNQCDAEKCVSYNLALDVDVTNFLRNFAVMAATLNQDSPLGNGNNYYLAQTGAVDGPGWAIVQYDHNNILSTISADLCDAFACPKEDLIHWSIERPTCRGFNTNRMAGPLLSDDALRGRYIQYVREFVEDVMTDGDFLQQVRGHLEAIRDEVQRDPWGDVALLFHWNSTTAATVRRAEPNPSGCTSCPSRAWRDSSTCRSCPPCGNVRRRYLTSSKPSTADRSPATSTTSNRGRPAWTGGWTVPGRKNLRVPMDVSTRAVTGPG